MKGEDFEELGCSLLMVLQPWCFWESEYEFCPRTSKSQVWGNLIRMQNVKFSRLMFSLLYLFGA